MYKLEIKTKYNTIHLAVEDLQDPKVQEILDQPYILEVSISRESKILKKGGNHVCTKKNKTT